MPSWDPRPLHDPRVAMLERALAGGMFDTMDRWLRDPRSTLLERSLTHSPPQVMLNLPDLIVREQVFDAGGYADFPVFSLNGRNVHATIRIKNVGLAGTHGEFNVRVAAGIPVPFGAHYVPPNYPLTVRVTNPIAAGSEAAIVLPHPIVVPEEFTETWILLTVTVDPPTSAKPGGEVWEASETNNVGHYSVEVRF